MRAVRDGGKNLENRRKNLFSINFVRGCKAHISTVTTKTKRQISMKVSGIKPPYFQSTLVLDAHVYKDYDISKRSDRFPTCIRYIAAACQTASLGITFSTASSAIIFFKAGRLKKLRMLMSCEFIQTLRALSPRIPHFTVQSRAGSSKEWWM